MYKLPLGIKKSFKNYWRVSCVCSLNPQGNPVRDQALCIVRYTTGTTTYIQLQQDFNPILTSTSQLVADIWLNDH